MNNPTYHPIRFSSSSRNGGIEVWLDQVPGWNLRTVDTPVQVKFTWSVPEPKLFGEQVPNITAPNLYYGLKLRGPKNEEVRFFLHTSSDDAEVVEAIWVEYPVQGKPIGKGSPRSVHRPVEMKVEYREQDLLFYLDGEELARLPIDESTIPKVAFWVTAPVGEGEKILLDMTALEVCVAK